MTAADELQAWQAELGEARQEDPTAPTMAELARHLGVSVQTAARKVRELAKQGRVTTGWKFQTSSTGARRPITTYRLTREPAPPRLQRPRSRGSTRPAKAR